ncbi:TIGR03756 family integrating conjugative element protein [Salmonella enterica subsp. enterica serovar Teko]|uniref:TIGR03756 family integrating conjugative element protein n=1 Tax=Salmonella enterica TaxID=28901 RepID=A0A5U0Q684_SALER|nr:TIGR03756 family integrating conjugative element protein [Salmonella enterica]EDX0904502.1 TIGR03756 family integrating conjugative element protein [Salmonella enterica subsp. enterica]EEG6053339.1 TIGR03756 family integrating conjugative element protein [Salmonella enterica subsp. enterica]EEN9966781.1 TIGR03756 family integrating conjugative element protein [Salmonella enterica subsp. enterica]EHC6702001.1 TIGR03756 family integrating conjugative element protein [Salmonella enterica subsp.
MSTIPNRLRPVALSLMLSAGSLPAADAAINTASIVASAISPSCISWRVSGICYWLLCTPFGCTVKTSVKVTHFIPETVVSVYQDKGKNPWTEMALVSGTSGGVENAVSGALAGLSAGGGSVSKVPGQRSLHTRFKYVDAIGHPATSLTGGQIPGYSCNSAATPLFPYFLSTLDSLVWRSGVPELAYPEALIPGKREVGSQASQNMWGNVYPRSGFITQQDDYKAGAVIAQRVADIITRSGQVHVYQPLVGHRSPGYWPPGPVTENTGTKNHKWQRLSPSLSQSCAVFPDTGGHVAEDGNYAWALWQPYSCCKRRGQTFLYSTDFS